MKCYILGSVFMSLIVVAAFCKLRLFSEQNDLPEFVVQSSETVVSVGQEFFFGVFLYRMRLDYVELYDDIGFSIWLGQSYRRGSRTNYGPAFRKAVKYDLPMQLVFPTRVVRTESGSLEMSIDGLNQFISIDDSHKHRDGYYEVRIFPSLSLAGSSFWKSRQSVLIKQPVVIIVKD